MGLYKIIETINNQNLFKYVAVIIFFIFYFKFKNIKLNVFLALILALAYINYNYDEINTTKDEEEEQKKIKREIIQPDPKGFDDRDDVIDFLFSIQDWYHYNPQSYEEMIDNLKAFFHLFLAIQRGSKFCDQYYQIAESKKNNAINALHALIFTIPPQSIMTDKLDRAHKRLETIMNDYLNRLYDYCHYDLLKNGYDTTRRAINIGPKEYNQYSNKDFTYQFY